MIEDVDTDVGLVVQIFWKTHRWISPSQRGWRLKIQDQLKMP